MSVIAIEPKEILDIIITLSELKETHDFINSSTYFIKYNENGFSKTEPNNFLGITLKYAMFATHFAYAVNYKEIADIGFLESEIEKLEGNIIDPVKAVSSLSSIIYNCYTNSGSCFLEEKWMGFLSSLSDHMKTAYPEPEVDIPSGWLN